MREAASTHPADRLLEAIEAKRSPVCVGIDPVLERLPRALLPQSDSLQAAADAIEAFCQAVVDAVSPYVPCVKFQSACFERYSFVGCQRLCELVKFTNSRNVPQVILDAKRGDIGISAEHYAAAAFGSDIPAPADWLTINSYLGEDGITPFLRYEEHGAFALVRTSNPGGDAIQNLQLANGCTVAHAVAELVARIGSMHVGERGYSALGAVVGATKPEAAAELRKIMPQQIFLVPGFGAQGGAIDDALACFNTDGTGALITASRSVMYAFDPDDPDWAESVGEAAAKFADEVGRAVGMRGS